MNDREALSNLTVDIRHTRMLTLSEYEPRSWSICGT
jgi:hypothetical protein